MSLDISDIYCRQVLSTEELKEHCKKRNMPSFYINLGYFTFNGYN